MSSSVNVTVRCAGCAAPLAMYHGVPRGPDARVRLAAAAKASKLARWIGILALHVLS